MRVFIRTASLFGLLLICLPAIGDDIHLMSLYPVPVKTSSLHVRFNYTNPSLRTLEIRNLIGKHIQEKLVNPSADEYIFDTLDNQPDGVYLVIAKDGNDKVIEIAKFTISR